VSGAALRRWALRAPDPDAVRAVCEATGLTPFAAAVLVNRGIAEPAEAARFLEGTVRELADPYRMEGLARAARRLAEAGRRGEPVLVYADYDADGATGAAVLVLVLRELFPALPVRVHQNHRVRDGYGVRERYLADAAREGVRVVVTVDCGIGDAEAVARAGAAGLDVIVTDHHLPGREMPPAFAVLDPRQEGCPYPDKDLAGVGVAFALARGVRRAACEAGLAPRELAPNLRRHLDLVALGTVADMAPLRGENRILVRAGLHQMRVAPRPGLGALLAAAGCAVEAVSEGDLAFRVAPRLNAASRIGDPGRSVEILLTPDARRAASLAAELHRDNARRQAEEESIFREAMAQVLAAPAPPGFGAIVLSDPAWHPGVLGIVASRLAERFHRPVVLLCEEGGEARGSCRSVEDFPLVDALAELAPLLTRFGGHRHAAGVAMPAANVVAFREAFSEAARRFARGRDVTPRVFADAEVRLGDLTPRFFEDLERLRPFGVGNEEPVFLARSVEAGRAVPLGPQGRHVRYEVAQGGHRFHVLAFHQQGLPVGPGEPLDLLFTPERSWHRGAASVRLLHRDARAHEPADRSS